MLPHREVEEEPTLAAIAACAAHRAGACCCACPAYRRLYGRHDRYVHQHRRYDEADLAPLAARAGLVVERVTFANCTLFPIVLAVHVLERLRHDDSGSSNRAYPAPVNAALRAVLRAEAALIRRGLKLPWGSSLIAVLRRPEEA